MDFRVKNEKDNVYTRLLVLEFDKCINNRAYWKCLCDPKLGGCGNVVSVQGRNLRNGDTKSCGCIHRVDLTDKRFGRLEVKGYKGKRKDKNGRVCHLYLCKCICGVEAVVIGNNLVKGSTKSCGCLQRELAANSARSRVGKKHPLYGKPRSSKTKLKISKSREGKYEGENSPNWNPNLTGEDRVDRRHIPGYKEWVKEVYKLDNYTCQKCGHRGSNLNSHHVEGYISNPGLRTEVSNGITLCKECHLDFHHQYGYGDNTRAQLIEFLRSL